MVGGGAAAELAERAARSSIALLQCRRIQRVASNASGFADTGMLGFQLERDLGGALLDSARTQELIGEFLARNSKQ
jgi:hypothetical protein